MAAAAAAAAAAMVGETPFGTKFAALPNSDSGLACAALLVACATVATVAALGSDAAVGVEPAEDPLALPWPRRLWGAGGIQSWVRVPPATAPTSPASGPPASASTTAAVSRAAVAVVVWSPSLPLDGTGGRRGASSLRPCLCRSSCCGCLVRGSLGMAPVAFASGAVIVRPSSRPRWIASSRASGGGGEAEPPAWMPPLGVSASASPNSPAPARAAAEQRVRPRLVGPRSSTALPVAVAPSLMPAEHELLVRDPGCIPLFLVLRLPAPQKTQRLGDANAGANAVRVYVK